MKSFLTASLLFIASATQAAALSDPQWQSWLDDDKPAELQRAATAKLKAQPGDTQATVALALAAINEGDAAKVDAAVESLETCVGRVPQQALCHYALGSVQIVRALKSGVLGAVRLAGTVKSELEKAVELDPSLFEAREALAQFYLQAPSFAGGSPEKALQLADAAESRQPEAAKMIRAMVFAREKQWPDMERQLDAVRLGDSKGFRASVANLWLQLGVSYMFDKQPAKANAVFERLQREQPASAAGPFGMARLQDDQGRHAEAVKLYQQAATLSGTQFLPIDYRMGIAAQAQGDKAVAKAAFDRYIANRRAVPKYRDDAKKRLESL
ncbi:MAG TPA: tetratricopeptide repeat protein [Burkholderiaceae bacterium]|jgi:tetratricopeptide (TPR) repeat protein